MRLLTLNLYNGGGNEIRFQRILETLRGFRLDVVVLQECLGWEEDERLAQTRAFLGLEHTFLGLSRTRSSGLRYPVVVLSRWPLQSPRTYADPEIQAHSLVEAGLPGFQLLATHLDAHSEEWRLRETEFLLGLQRQREAALLLGDLNCLSSRDPYPRDFAQQLEIRGMRRFGLPPRFWVTQALEEAGWHDGLHVFHPEGLPGHLDWVTARRQQVAFRCDYAWLSSALLPRLRSCRVVPISEAVSDHCPVLLELAE